MTTLRRKLMLAAALCLAADLGLAVWLLSPVAPSRAAATAQLEQARARLAALRAQDVYLRHFAADLHTSQDQLQELMAAGVPEQSEASSKLLTEFGRIAGLSQVQVSGAQFSPDKKARLGLRRVAINLQVAGSYSGVVKFLNQLERSPMFFILDQVGVSGSNGLAANGSQGPSQVKLELQLEAYVRAGA